jgi:hypothetical protein
MVSNKSCMAYQQDTSADVANVNAIQDKIVVKPLSAFQGKAIPPKPTADAALSNKVPVGPQPSLIASTGIKIFDEIGQAMVGNPLNPPDPGLVSKLASIGKMPSTEANATMKAALQTGITEGQKMIDAEVANTGTKVNGWPYAIPTGVYGTNYLFRAAVTQIGLPSLFGNSPAHLIQADDLVLVVQILDN